MIHLLKPPPPTKADCSQEKREDVINKCVASDPKHGEVWQRVRKDPKNAYLTTKEVLMEVMNQLEAKEVIS